MNFIKWLGAFWRKSKTRPLPALQRGFTLIELMIVIAIIGILASVAVPFFFPDTQKKYQAKELNKQNIVCEGGYQYFKSARGLDQVKNPTGGGVPCP